MAEQLTIITPCSRPQNLEQVARSIGPGRIFFDLAWLVMIDAGEYPESRVGNEQRNDALERVESGWVYFLDDDNLIHPGFFGGLREAIATYPQAHGFLFYQELGDGRIRRVNPQVNQIDLAQMVVRRELIGNERFSPREYNADGLLIEKLYNQAPGRWSILDWVMAYYNRI